MTGADEERDRLEYKQRLKDQKAEREAACAHTRRVRTATLPGGWVEHCRDCNRQLGEFPP